MITTRPEAITALLDLPDPPDIHRGHVLKHEGKPERFQTWRHLPIAFVVVARAERDEVIR